MEQGYSQPHTVPTLSDLGHKSEAALDQIVKYAETLNSGTLCVTLEDEQGRFRIWASNLGALQPADSTKSLDRRLKDAPLMRKSVASGLERLELSANRALAILNKSTPNRSISGGDAQPTTELDELLLSLRSAVNHLFGLSMLIRRQRPKGRLPELEELVLENSPDISYLTDKFPKAKSNIWLARRLGNNITRQRRLIQYRQHHRESLARRDVKGSDPTDAATIIATTFHEGDKSSETHQTPQDADSSQMSIFTSATSFLSLEDGTTTGRSIPDLSDLTLDGVQLDYGEPFECPYCRTIQNVKNRYEWKRHVFTDLQPYVCTFQDCVVSSKSFPTRAEWFQHESTSHRLQWNCNWCSQSDTTFHSAGELKKHLNSTHAGMVTGAQMEMVLETCQRPTKSFSRDCCPLCADWEPPSTKENAKSFSRHLARHLQQLALEALPLAIDGLEIRDACGLSDEDSSASHGSSNEEALTDQPDDPAAAAIQGKGSKVDPDEEPFRFLFDSPLTAAQKEAARKMLETIDHEALNANRIQERRTVLEAVLATNARHKGRDSTDNDVEHLKRLLKKEDQDILDKIQEEKKKATESAGAADVASARAAEELVERTGEDTNTRLEDSKKKAEKAPVRFKDAVGRKFSFPFHLCATWQGMEELIKQAFIHVDMLGPHVMEGRYDLMGPDGEIILPSVWEDVIEPGMVITMAMWPMDNMPRLTTQSAFPPHGQGSTFKPSRPPGRGVPPPPGYKPPPTSGTPNVVTAGPSSKKKPARRSGKDGGPSMLDYFLGKPEKGKKAGPSHSAYQPNEDAIIQ